MWSLTTGGWRLLLLLGLFLQCLPDGIANEQTACLAHRFDGVVIAGIEAHGQWALAQRFLPLRDAVLMLPEVFYRSHTLTRLPATQANGGGLWHQRYREALRLMPAWLLPHWT